MTDKQIIDLTEIDKKYKDKCSLIKAGKCKNMNIFIEQSRKLKAKEQECEELKKTIMYKCPQCGEEYLSPIGASLYEENNKLKQTLAEIKKICNSVENIENINSLYDAKLSEMYLQANKILKKSENVRQKTNR